MPELPLHLQRLEPLKGALDIIRFLGASDSPADADTICDSLDMSDRRFGKAIKRLVTVKYVDMNMEYEYQLTEKGQDAAAELAEYDSAGPVVETKDANKVHRRLTLAVPQQLVAGHTSDLHLGFHPDTGNQFDSSADVVLRISTIHALLSGSGDEMLKLDNASKQHTFQITPERYSQVRLKVQVFQLAPNGEDISMCGGMYVDMDVQGSGDPSGYLAYGTDVAFDPV